MILLAVDSPFALSKWQAFFSHFDLFIKAFLYTLGMSFFSPFISSRSWYSVWRHVNLQTQNLKSDSPSLC